MKKYKVAGILILLGLFWFPAKGEDSYFPIGVWGVGHRGNASLAHEESCFVNLGMNFMAASTRGVGNKPGWYEDTLMTICDRNGMKLCAGSDSTIEYDAWREQLWHVYGSFHLHPDSEPVGYGYGHSWSRISEIDGKTWQQRLDGCLTSMQNWGSHPSFFGYLALHENNIYCDTCNPAAKSICYWLYAK
jgi:hypothetical protein